MIQKEPELRDIALDNIKDALNIITGIDLLPVSQLEFAKETIKKITNNTIYVAFIGDFKRGKSTLVNTVLGKNLLPTGVTPVTAVPTFIIGSTRDLPSIE